EQFFNSDEDFIELYLKEKCKLSSNKIDALRERKFIIILDGYYEIIERERHCYIQNKFCEWKNAKIIISCRTEYLGKGYQKRFFPKNGEKGFQELKIKAFSEKEVNQYIIKYVQEKGHLLNLSKNICLQQIKKIPEELVSNPFLLKITLSALPRFIEQEKTTRISRIDLYNEFLKSWFDRAQERLRKIQLTDEERSKFRNLDDDDFSESCLQFSKNFAIEMFIDDNKVVITRDANWKKFLSNEDIGNSLLRFSIPLIRHENQYWFIHKTLRDYLIALALLESCEAASNIELFNKQSFVSEHGVRQFLAEHISQKTETFKPQLLAFIEASKENEVQIASANAITILTQVGVLLKNLNGCNISGADLSNGKFNNLQAVKAKLNNVNFENIELKNANLQDSFLQGANFQNAELQDANLQNSFLQNAYFKDTDLSFADIQNTILQDVQFTNVKFKHAMLQKANLQGSSLQNAYFEDAVLSSVNIQNTNLYNVNFENAKFQNANLQNVTFWNAELRNT
ncbi:22979_t:CDS:1, partial [Racocetra persica]